MQTPYFTMQLGCISESYTLGCIFIHSRVYENSGVHGFCTSCFPFEVWLHQSTNLDGPCGYHANGYVVVANLRTKFDC